MGTGECCFYSVAYAGVVDDAYFGLAYTLSVASTLRGSSVCASCVYIHTRAEGGKWVSQTLPGGATLVRLPREESSRV